MTKKFFILTGETRLADAIMSNYDQNEIQTTVEQTWDKGKEKLFGGQFDVLLLDVEALRGQKVDTFVTIDAMCVKEGIKIVLIVRTLNQSIQDLQAKMTGMKTVVETKKGRGEFNQGIRSVVSDALRKPDPNDSILRDATIDSVIQQEVDLPLEKRGNINDTGVFDVLFAVYVRRATGHITFEQGARKLRFAFRAGDLVLSDDSDGTADLLDTFSWSSGNYKFEKADSVSGRRKRMTAILSEAARNHIPRRMAMDATMSVMSQYPIPTTLVANLSEFKTFSEAVELSMRIDGQKTWSDLLSDTSMSFRAAFFLIHTHTVKSMPTSLQKISLTWSRDVRTARDREQHKQVRESKAYRAVAAQEEVEREMRMVLRDYRDTDAYGVFHLWEGCGAKAVQDRFYELVKEHHPDAYGGNTSGKVRDLAQDIFIQIKDAFVVLRKHEKGEQTAPPPIGFERPNTSKVTALEEPSEQLDSGVLTGDSEVIETADSPKLTPRPSPRPRVESNIDVKAKMEKLSAMRKKRSRRNSVPGRKTTRVPTPDPITMDLLSEVASEISDAEETVEEKETRLRNEKLASLRQRAKDKNPAGVSTAQEAFREGFRLFREEEFEKAFEKFTISYNEEPNRANHVAFYAYLWFKTTPDSARDAEELIRKAIEMNDRQTQPDALLFLAHMLKARGDQNNALKFYERALALNPGSREAERELRLAKMRAGTRNSEPGTFIKNLFKK